MNLMNGVKIRPNESLEAALSRFNRMCSGTLSELKNYRHYEKPSTIKNRKKSAAIRKRILKQKFAEKGKVFKERKD